LRRAASAARLKALDVAKDHSGVEVIARTRFELKALLLLAVVIVVVLLSATRGHADTREADLVRQGSDALKHHQYDIAIARFSDAIHLVPGDAKAWSRRGEAYARMGDFGRALNDCNQGIKLAPNSSVSYRIRGIAYVYEEDFDHVIADFDTAVRLAPRSALAYADRGDAFLHQRRADRAMSDFDQALRLNPSDSDTYAMRGNAWFAKGNYDRAWDDYNRAIQIDPKNAYAFSCRGFSAARLGAYDDAIADYDEAIRIDPSYKPAYHYRNKAEEKKSAAWWGKVVLDLMGAGVLALVFAAFRAYRSPTAFSHSVARRFRLMPEGSLVFYPRPNSVGYIVPDASTEQALRTLRGAAAR
jgi:tetratricopeptide (TPR) repeat protein